MNEVTYNRMDLVFGKMRDEVNIEFCEEVKKYPCIFDFNRPDYCNRNAQEQAWRKIADKFDTNVTDCKERWKNIRGRYSKYKNQLNRSSWSGTKRIRQYYLAGHLQFLDTFMKSRASKGKIVDTGLQRTDSGLLTEQEAGNSEDGQLNEDAEEEDLVQNMNNLISDSSSSTPLPTPIPEDIHTSSNRKRRRSSGMSLHQHDVNNSICSYFETKQRLLEQRQQSYFTSQPDPDEAFLHSVLPDLKAMNGRQKRRFKIEVLRLADEILTPQNHLQSETPVG